MVTLHTNFGDITIELDIEHTPKPPENFLAYAKSGHYDDTIFHRVMNGFMIQGGSFTWRYAAKTTNAPIREAKQGGANKKERFAMARTSDPHSASAQFL